MDKEHMFEVINRILDHGNNVEIRRKSDGTISIFEVKKNKVTISE